MFRTRNNPPAFPRPGFYPDTSSGDYEHVREMLPSITEPQAGMTLFDHFAGLALQGVLANFNCPRPMALHYGAEAQQRIDAITEWAIAAAHSMMKARAAYLELPLEPRAHNPDMED